MSKKSPDPSIVVSVRMRRSHLAYIHETLLERGYDPRNLSNMVTLATVDWIGVVNASIIHKAPAEASLKALKEWAVNRKDKKVDLYKAISNGQSGYNIHGEDIIPLSCADMVAKKDHKTALSIINAINYGVPIMAQLTNENPVIARISLSLARLIPKNKLTQEELIFINERSMI